MARSNARHAREVRTVRISVTSGGPSFASARDDLYGGLGRTDVSSPEASNRQARTGENRLRLWVLLDAHRVVLASGMALGVFVALVVLGALDPTPLRVVMRGTDPTDTVFQALVGGVITGVTLIISIAQLSVSQELGPASNQRERMTASLTLQEDIEDAADSISGPSPSTYLGLLCAASRQQARTLEEAVADNDDATLRDRVDRFADRVIENADAIEADFTDARFGEFEMVRTALNYITPGRYTRRGDSGSITKTRFRTRRATRSTK